MKENFRAIDGKKLRVLLDSYCSENHTNIYDLSKVAGYSASYIYDICKSGRIRNVGIDFLKKHCGIEYSQYMVKDGKPVGVDQKRFYKKRNKTVSDIDGKKLEAALDGYFAENGGNIYVLSESLGYSKKWLYDAIKTNRLPNVGIKLLKYECGIDFDQYKPEPKPEPVVENNKVEETKSEMSEQDMALMNTFFEKLDRIAVAIETMNDIQKKNSEYLEELKNMLK